jgi:hypothetical protein
MATTAEVHAELDRIAPRIIAAKNLNNLAETLVEWERCIATAIDELGEPWMDSENELAFRGVDICDLPNFGAAPESTEGVWSWDENFILSGWATNGAEICERNDRE